MMHGQQYVKKKPGLSSMIHTFCPEAVFLCFILSAEKKTISLKNANWMFV